MRIFLSFTFCFFLFSFCFAQSRISGKVVDVETGEELIGANISFKKDGDFITGVATDFDGNYKINIDPGTYNVIISYIGLKDKQINEVIVTKGQTTFLNISLISDGNAIEELGCLLDYKIPLIDKDNTTSGRQIISKNIQRTPVRSIKNLVMGMAGVSSQ